MQRLLEPQWGQNLAKVLEKYGWMMLTVLVSRVHCSCAPAEDGVTTTVITMKTQEQFVRVSFARKPKIYTPTLTYNNLFAQPGSKKYMYPVIPFSNFKFSDSCVPVVKAEDN